SYSSGASQPQPTPGWLAPYDGTLTLLAGGKEYAAETRDPGTCQRTIVMVAPSGRACYSLPVEGASECDPNWSDSLQPDGTLVLSNHQEVRWWPGLARPKP